MLRSLHIENYVLIDSLDTEISAGLNTITGETGAGKSILLGAVSLLLGAKADVSAIRDKSKNCVIEAVFDVSRLRERLLPIFDENDLEYDDNLTIRRIITPAGKSKAYLNDFPVLMAPLKIIGDLLIDIHSQHQTLLLGETAFQTEVLDSVSGNDTLLAEYTLQYDRYRKAQQQLDQLTAQSEQAKKEEEYLRFQYTQLEEAKLCEGEMEELTAQYQFQSNAALISDTIYSASRTLNEDENAVLPVLSNIASRFSKIKAFLPEGDALQEQLQGVIVELKEWLRETEHTASGIANDPGLLERLSQRIDLIGTLELKHKVSGVEALIALREEYKSRLSQIEHLEDDILSAKQTLNTALKEAEAVAEKISANRKKNAEKLVSFVTNTLAELGMPDSRIEVAIRKNPELDKWGMDGITFLFSANKGVPCEKIDKVASGGEMSRLMLTLKALVSKHRSLPTVIFDEIDTGVSGRIADKMGELIALLSQDLQIINITHLPQIAAKGDTHFFVYKQSRENDTVTSIRRLVGEERIHHIATMLSGSELTPSAISQAKALLHHQSQPQAD